MFKFFKKVISNLKNIWKSIHYNFYNKIRNDYTNRQIAYKLFDNTLLAMLLLFINAILIIALIIFIIL